MPIRVLLADDHEEFRAGLRRVLENDPELEVVAEGASGSQAVRLAGEWHPDVALLDVRMSPLNGIEAVPRILTDSPRTAVLMLSMHADRQYVVRTVRAGARGYLVKDTTTDILLEAIRAVHAGRAYFSPELAQFAAAWT